MTSYTLEEIKKAIAQGDKARLTYQGICHYSEAVAKALVLLIEENIPEEETQPS